MFEGLAASGWGGRGAEVNSFSGFLNLQFAFNSQCSSVVSPPTGKRWGSFFLFFQWPYQLLSGGSFSWSTFLGCLVIPSFTENVPPTVP